MSRPRMTAVGSPSAGISFVGGFARRGLPGFVATSSSGVGGGAPIVDVPEAIVGGTAGACVGVEGTSTPSAGLPLPSATAQVCHERYARVGYARVGIRSRLTARTSAHANSSAITARMIVTGRTYQKSFGESPVMSAYAFDGTLRTT